MKHALVTLLLLLAAASQPLMAIPASCLMPGKSPVMACSGCCAMKSCCAASKEQRQPAPVAVVVRSVTDISPATVPSLVALPRPLAQEVHFSNFTRAFRHAHAPSLLALGCIQLI